MISSIKQGTGFRGALDYCMEKNKNHEIIQGNMDGKNPKALAAEFKASRQLRPEIKKAVWHCSLSCPAGEKLSAEKWAEVAKDHMKNMKFDPNKNQYSVIRHKDTDYDHVHIVASKIDMAGKLWNDKFEAYRAIESTQALEKKYDLKKIKLMEKDRKQIKERKPYTEKSKKPLSRNELKMAERNIKNGKLKVPPRMAIQKAIDNSLKKKPETKILLDDLKQQNISIKINQAKTTGRVSGISFEKDGVTFKGSKLGKGYSWKGIQERGLNYEQKRDRETIERSNEAYGRAHGRNNQNTKGNSSRESTETNRFNNSGVVRGNKATVEGDQAATRKPDVNQRRMEQNFEERSRADKTNEHDNQPRPGGQQPERKLDRKTKQADRSDSREMEKRLDHRDTDSFDSGRWGNDRQTFSGREDKSQRGEDIKCTSQRCSSQNKGVARTMVDEKRNKIKELNSVEINKASLATERLKTRRKKAQAIQIEKQKGLQEAKKKEQRLKKSQTKINLNDPKYADLKKLRDEFFLLKKQKPQTPEDKKIHKEKLENLNEALRKEISRVNRLVNSDQLKPQKKNKVADRGATQKQEQKKSEEQILTRGRASIGESFRQRREREKTNSRGFSRGR